MSVSYTHLDVYKRQILKHVDPQDRFNTFNMGIGWVAIVRPEDAEAALKRCV